MPIQKATDPSSSSSFLLYAFEKLEALDGYQGLAAIIMQKKAVRLPKLDASEFPPRHQKSSLKEQLPAHE